MKNSIHDLSSSFLQNLFENQKINTCSNTKFYFLPNSKYSLNSSTKYRNKRKFRDFDFKFPFSSIGSFRAKEIDELENVKTIESAKMESLRMKVAHILLDEYKLFPLDLSDLDSSPFDESFWLELSKGYPFESDSWPFYEINSYINAYHESAKKYSLADRAIKHYRKIVNAEQINRKTAFRCLVSVPFKNLDDDHIPASNNLENSQDKFWKVGAIPDLVINLNILGHAGRHYKNNKRFNKIRAHNGISENPVKRAA